MQCSHLNGKKLFYRLDIGSNVCKERVRLLASLNTPQNNCNEIITHTKRGIVQADLCKEIVSICGMLLPKVSSIKEVRCTVVSHLQSLKQMVKVTRSP